jgi:hypothetical protein
LWFWYPGIVVGAGFFFGPAIFIGPLDFWCGFRWHQHQIFVNVNKTFVVHRPSITRMHGGTEAWMHNPVHRRGIAYRNPEIARRFGQVERPGSGARRSFRGFAPEGGKTGTVINPPARPDTGRQRMQPRSIGPGSRQFEQPVKPQSGRTQMQQPQSGATGFRNRQPVQTQKGNAFESFGSSGREVIQHSERGQSSIGGGGRSSSGRSSGGMSGSGFHGGSSSSGSSGKSGSGFHGEDGRR